MAFFGLSDITISNENNVRGPLGKLFENVGINDGSNTLRYPLDIGDYDKGHYMIFHVFKQKNSQYAGVKGTIGNNTIISNYKGPQKPSTSFASMINSKIDTAVNNLNKGKTLFGVDISSSFGSSSATTTNKGFDKTQYIESATAITSKSMLDTVDETKDSIVLYMPDTVSFEHSQGYGDLQLGNELGGKVMMAGQSVIDAAKDGIAGKKVGDAAIVAAAQFLGQKASGVIGQNSVAAGMFKALGGVNNPMLELIYQSPSFRSFSYEFMFYPRSEKEALEVQKIIERFRFHQAPEVDAGSSGLLLIPPSQFDIQFYYAGRPNPNIPTIGRCVMESISVNYAPNGWSAYEMPGEDTPLLGRTGMPTAIQMTLNFKETIIITKSDLQSGPNSFKPRNAGYSDAIVEQYKKMTTK